MMTPITTPPSVNGLAPLCTFALIFGDGLLDWLSSVPAVSVVEGNSSTGQSGSSSVSRIVGQLGSSLILKESIAMNALPLLIQVCSKYIKPVAL